MRNFPVTKVLTGLILLLMMFLTLWPAAAEAKAGDEEEIADPTAVVHFQEGEGEGEDGGEEAAGSLAGTGIALGLLALIFLLLAVVAVIGAASLGIIGLGYWQSESSD